MTADQVSDIVEQTGAAKPRPVFRPASVVSPKLIVYLTDRFRLAASRGQDGDGEREDEPEPEPPEDEDCLTPVDPCAPPIVGVLPSTTLSLHELLVATSLFEADDGTIACAGIQNARVDLGVIQFYDQEWCFLGSEIGYPAAYLSLAPLEERRIHIAQKRKTTTVRADRSKRSIRVTNDSASTTKSSTNTMNTSTARLGWSVSASASYGVKVGWSANVKGSVKGDLETKRERTLNFVSEETAKSSRQIEAESEITLSLSLETTFEHVEERHLKNPYSDRSVHLSINGVNQRFRVTTRTGRVLPCLVIDFDPPAIAGDLTPGLLFDDAFVHTHSQFLRLALVDDGLVEYLAEDRHVDRLEGSAPELSDIAAGAARCLEYIFDVPEVNWPDPSPKHDSPNVPPEWMTNIFARSSVDDSFDPYVDEDDSAYADANTNEVLGIYYVARSTWVLWKRDQSDPDLSLREILVRSVEYVRMLVTAFKRWDSMEPALQRKLLDIKQYTEIYRRIPMFLVMANELVLGPMGTTERFDADQGLGEGAESENASEAAEQPIPAAESTTANHRPSGTSRIVEHLNCFSRYYIEEFLHYLREWTGNTAVEGLLRESAQEMADIAEFLNLDESFIHHTAWVIPLVGDISVDDLEDMLYPEAPAVSLVDHYETKELVLPTDSIHVEPIVGSCVLPGLEDTDSRHWLRALPVDSAPWPDLT